MQSSGAKRGGASSDAAADISKSSPRKLRSATIPALLTEPRYSKPFMFEARDRLEVEAVLGKLQRDLADGKRVSFLTTEDAEGHVLVMILQPDEKR